MEKEKNKNLKNILIGISVFLLYIIASSIPDLFISLIGINYENLNIIIKQIYLTLYEITLTLIIIYIYRKEFMPNFKDFWKRKKKYIYKYIKYWFLILGLMTLSNLIITMFTTTYTAQNQQAIIYALKQAPIYTIIIATITAPIVEELIFRLSIRKIFSKNNILFIIFSGLVFGGMHVIGCTNLIDLLFIIPYSIPGFIFAYLYTKTNNICIPISLHFIHNTLMLIIQLLLIFI